MTGNALGYIEAIGLTAAVEAADTAVKSANVRLLGYELAKGDGMTTVKIEGDVGAVKAAVKAAAAAAAKVGTVVSTHVIANPAEGTAGITRSRDTVGLDKPDQPARQPAASAPPSAEKTSAPPPAESEPAQLPLEPAVSAAEPKEGKNSKGQSKKSGN